MKFRICLLSIVSCLMLAPVATASEVDQVLMNENQQHKVALDPVAVVDDLTFLRRASVDLIGRIPTGREIRDYLRVPADQRREKLVADLLQHERFADRWTAFFGDLLRLRSNATGGAALTAYVHEAIDNDMPYDELCRRLISANGKANNVPEVGFILGDDADPMAMAAVTAQTFMGIRISCAQCHDHPFDVWTRDDFYGLAAFFGKTRRIESQRTRVIYTTEVDQTTVLWPPADEAEEGRTAMKPRFPFELIDEQQPQDFINRLVSLRTAQERARQKERADSVGPVIDDLLAIAGEKANRQTSGKTDFRGIESEAKTAIHDIDVKAALYRQSQLRQQLADYVTSPRNRYFARSFVNRLWKELVGRGFVEPVDDFRADNPPSHPQTLDYLAEEFVASGYDFRTLVRMIVTSDAYQRAHVEDSAEENVRTELESNFFATPMRRMLSESLYDSIVTAGHLFDVKHPPGANNKTIHETVRVLVKVDDEGKEAPVDKSQLAAISPADSAAAMPNEVAMAAPASGYRLEDAIELDFTALLKKQDDDVMVDQMRVMSREELEAQRMQMERQVRDNPNMKYVTQTVERVVDDNPRFNSAFRMAGPAPDGHFLRVFGQPSRADLGEARDDTPAMRQALMMLNGRLTNEAARVGQLEPIYPLLDGEKADATRAVSMAYYEILTRAPSSQELADAKEIVAGAATTLDGMADLRWVLLNCNEFRFLP